MKIPQDKLVVKQEVEMLEVFSGFETKNRYKILDEAGKDQYYAYEQSGFFSRQFLKGSRPLEIKIIDAMQQPQMTIERKFFFVKPNYVVKSQDKVLGYVRKRKWFSRFAYNIFDENENQILKCAAQIPKHPWTYKVTENDQEVAMIQKKWSGLGKEAFTDADNFLVDYKNVSDDKVKKLLLATVFAIDMQRFESDDSDKRNR